MQMIVLGMHRSGTSALARVLNLMGAYFGPEGVTTGANQENPKGFWERRDVRALNDSILHAAGCDWNRVADFDVNAVAGKVLEDFNRQAAKLVLELDGHRPWMIKEPRLCLLLPLWRRFLEVPVGIHIYRNPVEVASSLHRRNGIPIPAGMALWERYVQSALLDSEGMPRIVVSHRQLITDPRTAVAKLLEDLRSHDVAGLRMPAVRELDAFISTDLYREREDQKDLQQFLGSRQVALFQQLQSGELPPAGAWDVPVDVLKAYESTLPPLNRPEVPPVAPSPASGIYQELKAIRALLGKQDGEATQRGERFVKSLRDELSNQAATVDALLQQKVTDLRIQRAALHHQLREARSVRRLGEDARIELAVMRPRLEQLDRQFADSLCTIETLKSEREAARLYTDELKAELVGARQQVAALVIELDASRLQADEARAELADARAQIGALGEENEAARLRAGGLEEELEAARMEVEELRRDQEALRLQMAGLRKELLEENEAARLRGDGLEAELEVARMEVKKLRGDQEASRLQVDGLRNELLRATERVRELNDLQDALRTDVAAAGEREAALESRLRDADEQLRAATTLAARLEQEVDVRYHELTELTRLLLKRESDLERTQADAAEAQRQLAGTNERLSKIMASRSWRATRPLRYLGRLLSGQVGEPGRDREHAITLVSQSGLFDADWYLGEYPDVAQGGVSPLEHFMRFGAFESRNPGPHFDTGLYLRENPDVADSGLNPLVHYLAHGRNEGRACK